MWNVYKNSGHSSVLRGHKIKPNWRVLPDCTCSRRAMEGSKEELLRELINTACKSISPSCFSVGVSRWSFSQGLLRRGDIAGQKESQSPAAGTQHTTMILISNSNEIQRKSRANGSIVSRLSQRVSLSVAIDSSALVGHLFTLSQFLFLFLFTLSLYLFTELLI